MTRNNYVIGIHAGHAVVGSRGAKDKLDEVIENRKIKKYCIERLESKGFSVVDCTVHSGTQKSVLNNILKKSKKYKTDLNVSLHLNAGGGNGVEVYAPSYDKLDKACNASHYIWSKCGFKHRGGKKAPLFVTNHLKNCYLYEIGFVDSEKDYELYKKNGEKKIGYVVADSIIKYLMEV